MKKCSKCFGEKATSSFVKRASAKDGLHSICKECTKIEKRKWYEANRDLCKQRSKEHRERTNPAAQAEYKRKWYLENRERQAEKSRLRYQEKKESIRESSFAYRAAHRDRINARQKDYNKKNAGIRAAKQRAYYAANKAQVVTYIREYRRERMKTDPIFALKQLTRRRIAVALKNGGYSKKSSTESTLGCTWDFLKAHLESKFLPGMSWENRGAWEIDHKIPLASAQTEQEVYALSRYTNLQPLWASDNRAKGAKMPHQMKVAA